MNKYLKADERLNQIIAAACDIAENSHYTKVRRHQLVKECGTAAGNISRLVVNMDNLRDLIVCHAVTNGMDTILAQAIIDKHPAVDELPQSERLRILGLMA